MENPERLNQLAQSIHRPLGRYLKAKAVCERYDRGKHTVLGRIIVRLRADPSAPKSYELIKAIAYTDAQWTDYLKEWKKAEDEKIKNQIEYENLTCQLEALQSYFAYQRDTLKHLGG